MISDAALLENQPVLAAITIFGSGRLGPTTAAVLGLVGSIIGVLALRARSDAGMGAALDHRGGAVAVALGAISFVLGGLFLATADAGPGTGNGVVGSAAALAFGPLAMVLGGRALARRRSRSRGPAPASGSDGHRGGAPNTP